ncbi:hypothetical protein APHAL10511_008648 [Amanita phalloides]|nr:hypothetical protein APHAL10511_008648 [Amanita phalloides]
MRAKRGARRSPDSDEDPLVRAIRPSPSETPEERLIRVQREQEAKAISDTIDEELQKQAVAEKKASKAVKILLLGQSESGKSTTLKSASAVILVVNLALLNSNLKDFQLLYEPKVFRAERASWRAIIQLNVVRSILLILEAVDHAASHDPKCLPLSPDLLRLRMRLTPLRQVEETLLRRLSIAGSGQMDRMQLSYTERGRAFLKEISVSVNAAVRWKDAMTRGKRDWDRESFNSEEAIDWDDPSDPGVILHACAEDMMRIWNDAFVRNLLAKQCLRLEEVAGFFLDSLDRVTSLRYIPTNSTLNKILLPSHADAADGRADDILRARVKTLGVTEHRFRIKSAGSAQWKDWRIYDVGGHRSQVCIFATVAQPPGLTVPTSLPIQRAAWVPYFDDMDAIIFLAPIRHVVSIKADRTCPLIRIIPSPPSAFDQVLSEDPSVNRLEDSVSLWKALVSNKLLRNTNLILFLNKSDILTAKLKAGVRLADFIVSYGDRPNDFEHTSAYIRRKFATIFSEYSARRRMFYSHCTNVTDTKSTKIILYHLKDMVLRQHLLQTSLIH